LITLKGLSLLGSKALEMGSTKHQLVQTAKNYFITFEGETFFFSSPAFGFNFIYIFSSEIITARATFLPVG
jgi:hypothetical protein